MKKLTEKEAWLTLADTIEDWGMLPLAEGKCPGLCLSLVCMNVDGIISSETFWKMRDRLQWKFWNNRTYYWPKGKTAPRIKACRGLAKECE